jgi:uncharacterized protein (TIGR03086 family)
MTIDPGNTGGASNTTGTETATIVRNYSRSLDVLERAIRTADPGRWDDPSPCEAWTARQVAGHAMTFIGNVVALAGSGPAPDFHAPVDFAQVAGADPNTSWTETRHLVESELLTRPDRLAAVRMTPLGVEMTICELLTFQGMDPVVHGWDVATATGGTIEIPADLATMYRQRFEPVADQVRAAGLLGAATPASDDPVDALLGFCGRRR